jgi:flagellar biosynthesis protein FlhF
VGKSTTLAKLASLAAYKDHHSVGLITTDTYRVAAVEQLKVYARLLKLPLQVVSNRKEMQTALRAFANRDLVLIDTAGQSPNDRSRLREIEDLLKGGKKIHPYLVLSATTKHSDTKDILRRFEPVGYKKLILTKLDESRSHGILLNAPHWSGCPITYLGVGQDVPGDIEVATRERVADLVLNLTGRFLD